jgi:gamma-glutamyltranspeptidase/glutathione hydrolase
MLNMLEGLDLRARGHNSPAYLHRLVETIKLAFADRDAYFADPNVVKIPDFLLSKAYAARRSALVGDKAWRDMPPAGTAGSARAAAREPLPLAGGAGESLDTSYVAVVDAEGNAFSATPSDPNADSPVVAGVGCVVSPRGSQGWLDPAHPSVVAPGKRPRLTPAPAIAFGEGRRPMPFGTPGGDVQQQAMLQVFLNIALFDMPPQKAVEMPRLASRSFPDSFWPHVMSPGKVEMEGRFPSEIRAALGALGHDVSIWPDWEWRAGGVCAVQAGPDGTRWAAADPRRGAHAIGR